MTFYRMCCTKRELDDVKMATQKECAWGNRTFAMAAECGNLDVMKWLHGKQCPMVTQRTIRLSYPSPSSTKQQKSQQ